MCVCVYNAIQYPDDDAIVHYLCTFSGLVAEDVAIKQIRLHRGYRVSSYFIAAPRKEKYHVKNVTQRNDCRRRERKLWRISSWISKLGREKETLRLLPLAGTINGCTSAKYINILKQLKLNGISAYPCLTYFPHQIRGGTTIDRDSSATGPMYTQRDNNIRGWHDDVCKHT